MGREEHSNTRAERLRALAEGAQNLVDLASLTDETLAKARLDLLALAGAARALGAKLEREADESEVTP